MYGYGYVQNIGKNEVCRSQSYRWGQTDRRTKKNKKYIGAAE